jgi:hypothetical protein
MKVALLGATSFVGSALLKEALNRTGTSRSCPAALYGSLLKARNDEGCLAKRPKTSRNSNLF